MKEWFTIVEYLRCPFCNMVFDPKGLKPIEDKEGKRLVCRFCHRTAPVNIGEKESRL
jgi:uncharacterized protein YbaR (Trm112 family)